MICSLLCYISISFPAIFPTCLPLITVTPLLILNHAGHAPASGTLQYCSLGLECSSPRYSHAYPDHCVPSCISSLFNPTFLTHLYCFNFSKAPADLLNTSVILFVLFPLGSEFIRKGRRSMSACLWLFAQPLKQCLAHSRCS